MEEQNFFKLIFPLQNFNLVLRYFSLLTGSLSNPFFLLTLSQISFISLAIHHFLSGKTYIYFRKNLFYMHSFSEPLQYAYRSNFFIIFVANKIFKTVFTKRKVGRCFINMLLKFVCFNLGFTKLYIFLPIFIYN